MPLSESDLAVLTEGLERDSLEESLSVAVSDDPDRYAKDRNVAQELGTTVEAVRDDLEGAKRQSVLSKADLEALIEGYPVTKEQLKDTEFATLTQDEINQLTKVERSYQQYLKSDDRKWYEGMLSSSLIGAADAFIGGTKELFLDWMKSKVIELENDPDIDPEKYQRLLDEINFRIKANLKESQIAQEEITKLTPSNLNVWQASLRGGAQSVLETAPTTVVSLGTGGAINTTAALLSVKQGLSSYMGARVEGKEPNEALLYGGLQGLAEYGGEYLPNKYLGEIGKNIGKSKVGKEIANWFGTEFVGEQATTAAQTITDVTFDMDEEIAKADSWEEIAKIQARRQIITGLSTIVGGGTMSAGFHGLNYVATREQVVNRKAVKVAATKMESAKSQDWLDEHIELAQSMALRERAPDKFKEYLEQFDEQGAMVYIKADALGELEGLPDYVVKQLDGTGADVAIPMSDFLVDFASNDDLLSAVRPHVKVREDLMTMDEIQSNVEIQSVDKLINRAKEAKEDFDEATHIFEEVKTQLVGTGRQGRATASIAAELYPAFIVAQKEALASQGVHVTVKQLYEDMGLEIIGPNKEPDLTPNRVMEQEEVEYGKVYDTRGRVVDTEPAGRVILRGYPLTREEADKLRAEGAHVVRKPIHGPDTTGEEGWFLDEKSIRFKEVDDSKHYSSLYSEVKKRPLWEIGGTEKGVKWYRVVPPRQSAQQYAQKGDLSGIEVVEYAQDGAGNTVEIRENAQDLWNYHSERLKAIEELRDCING